jgi:hypothetical protein
MDPLMKMQYGESWMLSTTWWTRYNYINESKKTELAGTPLLKKLNRNPEN